MARKSSWFSFALAIAAVVFFNALATPGLAQMPPLEPTGGTLTGTLTATGTSSGTVVASGSDGVTLTGTLTTGTSSVPKAKQYPEVQQAVQLLLGPKHDKPGAIKVLESAARTYPDFPRPTC